MTIGKELQKQRRAKQLSLEAVSQTLRVDQATLQKIEADDFQGLNPVMVRSCIRQYASLLGLDGAQLLDQFTEPAAAGKDIPAAKPAIPVKEKVTEVRAANPAPVKEASPAGKAKEILDKSKVPHGFKAIFKFFDAINLDKLLKIGIWVILGLAVVGSVAGGFNALASKPTSISHSSSSSSSSSPSSSSSSKPAQDDSAKPDENKPSHDDQPSQQSQSQSNEKQVSSSSEASSSSSVASSSSQEQSRQASSSSSQSSTDTTTDTNE
ncbi:helix-turn-helix domain-containing protein [Lactobacillus delbrueckii subsp. lactis]|uniref:helix-turn-helix domain-containing protein n=1 Tax=Lactobacillus delbrueckii TaxID=1584 RepID=UPI0001EC324A|nr:helix-turn-helix transcriptional regulator [Lactobacillus delbrueckii]ADQ61777.1 LysM domain [Lactobacillus delbrueckii subsp. bulgaricus ND02]MBO3081703.1 helix-turn-helix domain-containing protein [Lactobacillus delbrueckii subsp. bulgaricus]MCD5438134.1 helix-turn-helix domain-containing protein [Lactobacillus delbrueckii subsp. lactis]MCD5468692.1 helix-turn-helix domain-containing protein [Lactobacillus delbrueckii subsp. lactis]MCZ0796236.1 helix-turn-helix transcriptional regulator [